jgi:hypothetical protein
MSRRAAYLKRLDLEHGWWRGDGKCKNGGLKGRHPALRFLSPGAK